MSKRIVFSLVIYGIVSISFFACTFSYIKGEDEQAKEPIAKTSELIIEKKYSPNFVVIFADDMGYGDVASFGNPNIRTPNLDRMGIEGQKWTQFYSADPVCTPSRAGLLTGRYPIRNGMTSKESAVLFPNSTGGLPQGEITIAEPGSVHYQVDSKEDPAFYPKISTYQVPLLENTIQIERPADQTTITRRYAEKAVEFITDNKDKPFFLYLPHSMPHIPLFAGEEFYGKSKRGHYGDVIEEIDWSVGQVMKTLEALEIADNTVVIFTSDNGPWLLFKTHGGSAGPLKDGKGTHFEGGQRVPTFFWGPGIVKPAVITEVGSTIDIMHTIASLADLEIPSDRKMDSYDLSPVLTGTDKSPRSEFYYWGYGELAGVRSGNYKLVVKERKPILYWNKVEMERPKLFDLETDISEKYDLYDLMPEKVKELQAMMDAHIEDTADSLPDNLAARIKD